MRAQFARARRTECSILLDQGQLGLDTRERGPPGHDRHVHRIVGFDDAALLRFRIDHGDGARAVLTEGQQQFEARGPALGQQTRLCFFQPAFGDQIVKEWRQAGLREEWRCLKRKGMGYGRLT